VNENASVCALEVNRCFDIKDAGYINWNALFSGLERWGVPHLDRDVFENLQPVFRPTPHRPIHIPRVPPLSMLRPPSLDPMQPQEFGIGTVCLGRTRDSGTTVGSSSEHEIRSD
jgi:hypothetical protein